MTLFSQGRKKKKNPHLVSARKKSTTFFKFAGCPVGAKRVSSGCLVGVWRVAGGCLEGVWLVSEGCQDVSGWCLEGIYGMSKCCLGCLDLYEG